MCISKGRSFLYKCNINVPNQKITKKKSVFYEFHMRKVRWPTVIISKQLGFCTALQMYLWVSIMQIPDSDILTFSAFILTMSHREITLSIFLWKQWSP